MEDERGSIILLSAVLSVQAVDQTEDLPLISVIMSTYNETKEELEQGISKHNMVTQYLFSRFLAKNRRQITAITEQTLKTYAASVSYQKEQSKYEAFLETKQRVRKEKKVRNIIQLLFQKYTYLFLAERLNRYHQKWWQRNRRGQK